MKNECLEKEMKRPNYGFWNFYGDMIRYTSLLFGITVAIQASENLDLSSAGLILTSAIGMSLGKYIERDLNVSRNIERITDSKIEGRLNNLEKV